jgi:hypothetical protein
MTAEKEGDGKFKRWPGEDKETWTWDKELLKLPEARRSRKDPPREPQGVWPLNSLIADVQLPEL